MTLRGSCHPTAWLEAAGASATRNSLYFFLSVSSYLLEAKIWTLHFRGVPFSQMLFFLLLSGFQVVRTQLSLMMLRKGSLSRKEHLHCKCCKRRKCQIMASFLITEEPVLTAPYKGGYYQNFRNGIFCTLSTAFIKPSSSSLNIEVFFCPLRGLSVSICTSHRQLRAWPGVGLAQGRPSLLPAFLQQASYLYLLSCGQHFRADPPDRLLSAFAGGWGWGRESKVQVLIHHHFAHLKVR